MLQLHISTMKGKEIMKEVVRQSLKIVYQSLVTLMWRRPMTDKKWSIICDCTWCNGKGETYGNDPNEKAEECRKCEGHGIEEFYEDGDEYENEEEVREDYKSKDILFVALVDRAWGSLTTRKVK